MDEKDLKAYEEEAKKRIEVAMATVEGIKKAETLITEATKKESEKRIKIVEDENKKKLKAVNEFKEELKESSEDATKFIEKMWDSIVKLVEKSKLVERIKSRSKEVKETIKKDEQDITHNQKRESDNRVGIDQEENKKRKSAIRELWEYLKQALNSMSFGDKMKATWNGFLSTTKTVMGKVLDITKNTFSKVKKTLENAWNGAKQSMETFKENFRSSFVATGKLVIDVVLSPIQHTKEAIASLGSKIKSTVEGIASKKTEDGEKTSNIDAGKIRASVAQVSKVAVTQVGKATLSVGKQALDNAIDLDSAMNQFLASTGKGEQEAEKYKTVMKEIYADNYGESFEDIGRAMEIASKAMGDIGDDDLKNVIEGAYTLRDVYGIDIADSIKTAGALMNDPNINGAKAMDLLAAGAKEYGESWSELGEDDIDRLKDLEKEAGATAEAMDKLKKTKYSDLESAFKQLGRSVEILLLPLAEVLIPILEEIISGILPHLSSSLEDVGEYIREGKDLFAEILPAILEPLSNIIGIIIPVVEELVKDIAPVFIQLFPRLLVPLAEMTAQLLPALLSALEVLLNVLNPILILFIDLLNPILKLISEAIAPLIEAVMEIIDMALVPLMGVIAILGDVFSEQFTGIVNAAITFIQSISDILLGIVGFIKNVFSGKWEEAFGNLVDIVKNIGTGIGAAIKVPINFIIDSVNGFVNGINGIKIPDWVPVVGGKNLNIPLIPRLKVGLDYVPSDFFPAFLDEGEMVLTRSEANWVRSMGGLGGLEYRLSGGQFNPDQKVVLGKGCIVVQTVLDGRTLAQTSAPYLNEELGNIAELRNRGV